MSVSDKIEFFLFPPNVTYELKLILRLGNSSFTTSQINTIVPYIKCYSGYDAVYGKTAADKSFILSTADSIMAANRESMNVKVTPHNIAIGYSACTALVLCVLLLLYRMWMCSRYNSTSALVLFAMAICDFVAATVLILEIWSLYTKTVPSHEFPPATRPMIVWVRGALTCVHMVNLWLLMLDRRRMILWNKSRLLVSWRILKYLNIIAIAIFASSINILFDKLVPIRLVSPTGRPLEFDVLPCVYQTCRGSTLLDHPHRAEWDPHRLTSRVSFWVLVWVFLTYLIPWYITIRQHLNVKLANERKYFRERERITKAGHEIVYFDKTHLLERRGPGRLDVIYELDEDYCTDRPSMFPYSLIILHTKHLRLCPLTKTDNIQFELKLIPEAPEQEHHLGHFRNHLQRYKRGSTYFRRPIRETKLHMTNSLISYTKKDTPNRNRNLGKETPRISAIDLLPICWKVVNNRLVKRTNKEMKVEEEEIKQNNKNNNMRTGEYFQEGRMHGHPATMKSKHTVTQCRHCRKMVDRGPSNRPIFSIESECEPNVADISKHANTGPFYFGADSWVMESTPQQHKCTQTVDTPTSTYTSAPGHCPACGCPKGKTNFFTRQIVLSINCCCNQTGPIECANKGGLGDVVSTNTTVTHSRYESQPISTDDNADIKHGRGTRNGLTDVDISPCHCTVGDTDGTVAQSKRSSKRQRYSSMFLFCKTVKNESPFLTKDVESACHNDIISGSFSSTSQFSHDHTLFSRDQNTTAEYGHEMCQREVFNLQQNTDLNFNFSNQATTPTTKNKFGPSKQITKNVRKIGVNVIHKAEKVQNQIQNLEAMNACHTTRGSRASRHVFDLPETLFARPEEMRTQLSLLNLRTILLMTFIYMTFITLPWVAPAGFTTFHVVLSILPHLTGIMHFLILICRKYIYFCLIGPYGAIMECIGKFYRKLKDLVFRFCPNICCCPKIFKKCPANCSNCKRCKRDPSKPVTVS